MAYHIYTLYLFTASDFIAVLWPQTIFAVGFALTPALNAGVPLAISNILARLPSAILWIWFQLLVLDLSNQRRPDSVAEDKLNKPWRPIPSGRLTKQHTRQLLLCSVPTSYALSTYLLGGKTENATLFVLNWIYNDLDAAENWILRNLLNALGITTIGAGATAVITGRSIYTSGLENHGWLLICAAILLTTIQGQDLYDQEGDRERGRDTMPLVLGDEPTRWLTAGLVLFWSLVVPSYWRTGFFTGLITALLPGLIVAKRLLTYRDVISDRRTFRFWALWIVGLYLTPAIKATWG
jgi:4-hydroxybenzoate polyprenyltransferase